VCKDCLVTVLGRTFRQDLVRLPLVELDIILGMDWLSVNGVNLDCRNKTFTFKNDAEAMEDVTFSQG
jgi:hypothetical protein